jgi:outer membrane lipoprotein-sorting protein
MLTYRYYGYPDDFIFRYQKAVESVTRADILRVAKEYLDPSKFVIVAVGNPKDFGKPLTSLDIPVSNIDLTIPGPKSAARAPADAGSAARAKAILAKAQAAIGGADKLAAVQDVTYSANMQLDQSAGGLKVTQTTQWMRPNHFRQENRLPFGNVITYTDGKTGWMATPQGVGQVPDAQMKQAAFEAFRLWPSLLLSDRDADRTVTEAGPGKVEISDHNGNSVLLTFDATTGLPESETFAAPGGAGDVTEAFGDWQESGGLKAASKVTLIQGGHHYADITISNVTVNQGLTADQISKKP